jgi:hypothetical protein
LSYGAVVGPISHRAGTWKQRRKGRLESGTGERSERNPWRVRSTIGAGSDDLGECHFDAGNTYDTTSVLNNCCFSFSVYGKKLGPSIDRYPNGVCNGRPGRPAIPDSAGPSSSMTV